MIIGLNLALTSPRGRASGGPAPDPYAPWTETFTDTDGVAITSHTADSGGSYAIQSGFAPASPALISSNRLRGQDVSGIYRYTGGTMFDGNGRAAMIVDGLTSLTDNDAVGMRWSSGAATGYMGRYLGGTGWQILRFVAGSGTAIGNTYADSFTPVVTRTGLFQVYGNTLILYVDGEARAWAVDDTIAPAAGQSYIVAAGVVQGAATGRQITSISTSQAKAAFGDTFTFSDGNLTTVDTNWVRVGAAPNAESTISSGNVAAVGTDATGNLYCSPDLAVLDQGVSVDMKFATAGSGPFVVCSAVDVNNYVGFRCTATGTLQVHVRVGGTFTQQGADIASAGISTSRVTMEVYGSQASGARRYVIKSNGVTLRDTNFVTAFTPGTRAGFNARGAAANPFFDNYLNYAL